MPRVSKKRKFEQCESDRAEEPSRKRMKTRRKNNKKKKIKKMTIKQFAVQPKLNTSYEKETIEKLICAIDDIHHQRGGQFSFEELYKACSSLCSLKKGHLIYDKLYKLCDAHIEAMINGLSENDSGIIGSFTEVWNHHRSEMHAIRQVFLMLDRTYVRQETDTKSLWKMGINLLKKHLLPKHQIISKIISEILRAIESERKGEEINKTVIKTCIVFIAHLHIYKSIFEKELIIESNKYYALLGNKLIECVTTTDYLNIVMKALNEEHCRCTAYLDTKTQRHLSIAIEKQMIDKHCHNLLNKGFYEMCDKLLVSDLRHLYKLLANVNKVEMIKERFTKYCCDRGTLYTNDIEQLLQFKSRLDTIISKSFQRNHSFRNIIRRSWEQFINKDTNCVPQLLAAFIDRQLQSVGARGTSEMELELKLDRVMDIFRFVHGKDVFQAFYKKDLAKRLLLNTSSSSDAEKNMINRIRKECGQTVASNLERMFKDINISHDLNIKFLSTDTSINFTILTSGCWPTYNTDVINLPNIISAQLAKYNQFYVSINNGRKLSWTCSLSHCIMAANFPKGRKELVLSAFQATVLLLFNHKNKLDFKSIASKTLINEKQLRKTVLSLVKANILLKKTKGMQCSDTEVFKLNAKYENRLRRIKVNQIQSFETKTEQKQITQKIKKDRQYQIDACVVRIMKARKQLSHQQLMVACMDQLKFDAIPKQIKKRIEKLIENEYIERDKNNNTVYHYKA